MINRFCKLSTDFKFDFDVETVILKFVGDLDDYNETNKSYPKIYNSPTGLLHWQYFPCSNSRFARNMYKNLRHECDAIADNLTRLQHEIKHSDNTMTDQFLKHTFNGNKIGLIKQEGHSVNPHVDFHRSLTLNIGLKNSNTSRVWVGDQSNLDNFDLQSNESYIMQDHDVYLLNSSIAHSVETLTTTLDRYVITYAVI
jgi:hypothetical protein